MSQTIFIDADACPVKDEIYKVADRYQWQVKVVANAWLSVPTKSAIEFVLVPGGLDAADDWIAENAQRHDIVVTSDIPLAARCLENHASVIDSKGNAFSESSIGSQLASRELLAHLRDSGAITGGPKAYSPKDRSQFLQCLDQHIQKIRRELAD